MVTCIAYVLLAQATASLHDLAYARGDFEARTTSDCLYVMMMNSNGYNEALYPIGVASRRYLIDYGAGPELAFQEIRNGAPKTIWRLVLRDGAAHMSPKNAGTGTLSRLISQADRELAARRLTRAQKAALNANVNFVGYFLLAETDFLSVSFVNKDGTRLSNRYEPNPMRAKTPFFPIPAEESKLLGLGSTEWHGSVHIR